MGFLSVLTMAQRWVAERIGDGAIAIDATAGNGVDTLFLARTVGPRGRVYAFDVQLAALSRTRERLAEAADANAPSRSDGGGLAPVELLHAGHERMAELVPAEQHGRVRAVMFNLGYLPGDGEAKPSVITRPDTTLPALEAALAVLAPGGVMTVVVYPGHESGSEEAAAVEAWTASVHPSYAQAALYRFPQKASAPYLLAFEKK